SLATVPPAPARFSTITCWPMRSESLAARIRPKVSELPPGACGTMRRTGFVGHCCAFEFREKKTKRISRRNITLSSAWIRSVVDVQRSPVHVLGARGSEPEDRRSDLFRRADAPGIHRLHHAVLA